jgi:hypothetical protein
VDLDRDQREAENAEHPQAEGEVGAVGPARRCGCRPCGGSHLGSVQYAAEICLRFARLLR